MPKIVPFANLDDADLVVDAIYEGGEANHAGSDLCKSFSAWETPVDSACEVPHGKEMYTCAYSFLSSPI